MTSSYQLTLLINSNLSEDSRQTLLTQIQAKLAEVKNTDLWGKRSLSYPINHLDDAYFVHIEFSSNPQDITALDKQLKSSDDIIRFLLTRKN